MQRAVCKRTCPGPLATTETRRTNAGCNTCRAVCKRTCPGPPLELSSADNRGELTLCSAGGQFARGLAQVRGNIAESSRSPRRGAFAAKTVEGLTPACGLDVPPAAAPQCHDAGVKGFARIDDGDRYNPSCRWQQQQILKAEMQLL